MLHNDAAVILRHSNVYIARVGRTTEGRKKERKEEKKEGKKERAKKRKGKKKESKKNERKKEEEVKCLLKSLCAEAQAYIFLLPIP